MRNIAKKDYIVKSFTPVTPSLRHKKLITYSKKYKKDLLSHRYKNNIIKEIFTHSIFTKRSLNLSLSTVFSEVLIAYPTGSLPPAMQWGRISSADQGLLKQRDAKIDVNCTALLDRKKLLSRRDPLGGSEIKLG